LEWLSFIGARGVRGRGRMKFNEPRNAIMRNGAAIARCGLSLFPSFPPPPSLLFVSFPVLPPPPPPPLFFFLLFLLFYFILFYFFFFSSFFCIIAHTPRNAAAVGCYCYFARGHNRNRSIVFFMQLRDAACLLVSISGMRVRACSSNAARLREACA